MTKPLMVINVVGLTREMLGDRTPHLTKLANQGFSRSLGTVLPAVTCSAQATLLTGLMPRDHGIVANGWYARDLAEVMFWKQSNRLVQGEKIFETAKLRDPAYTTAKMFWWYNMYAPVEWSVTPRPSYPADGRKVFDSYSQPEGLKDELQSELGVFPLLRFWGPGADITSSRWIVDASIKVFQEKKPNLTLVYLPHLDYNLQRLGVSDPAIDRDIREIDQEAGRLIEAG
ncbi:MAG: alkaline phosphatase family protein, partial [Planctomycetaceae bacterium]|nr:alkaline phosphatase family protein [Planctomycetaceae bacterium]